MKIFSDKPCRLKPKLQLVIAGDVRSQKLTVAGFYREFVLVAQGYTQIDWFWWIERIGVGFVVNNIPLARKLPICRSAWLNRCCQQD
jgi:hypothetical protein